MQISSADGTDRRVSPFVLNNLARTLEELGRYLEAAEYATRVWNRLLWYHRMKFPDSVELSWNGILRPARSLSPVSLGAYVLKSFDPDGKWYVWQLRDDWQRTSLGRFGKPGPKYLAYVDPGPPDKRVIAQMNHELDVIHDVAPEGMFTLAKQSKSSRAWLTRASCKSLKPCALACAASPRPPRSKICSSADVAASCVT